MPRPRRPRRGPKPDRRRAGGAMIELTKDRLEEVQFFLGQLRQQKDRQAQPNKPPSKHFRYYLNAFLNAARSVEWVLETEEPKKYKAWIGSWEAQRAKAEAALQKLMKDMRDTSVHEGLTETTIRSEEVPIIVAPPARIRFMLSAHTA
jgi:hypothetical protein